jgi:dihydrofolate reductase
VRKVIMFNRISVDGFFAGPNGEINWFVGDPEVDKATHEMMQPDTILYGRVTYQLFEGFWPNVAKNPDATKQVQDLAEELNQMTKVVFSSTLEEVSWVNSKLIKGDLLKEVQELKQGEGADIAIFGSGSIVQQLADAGLVDEYLIVVTPVVLGSGKPLFKDVQAIKLNLLETRSFKSGNVVFHYRVEQ